MTDKKRERRNTAARNIDLCNQMIRQLEAEKARWLAEYVDTAEWRGTVDDLPPDMFRPEAIGPVMVDEDAVSEKSVLESTSSMNH
jgi:hypothetical protein